MDPSECLTNIYNAMRNLRNIDPDDVDIHSMKSEVEYLLEHFDGLNDWMSRGGRPPVQWDR
jgi:hypothetical protein